MAFRAFPFPGARFELAAVRVRLVAIRAVFEWKRPLEVSVEMALGAADLRVFSEQRIFCFRVVKLKSRQRFFPSSGRVTVLAALLE